MASIGLMLEFKYIPEKILVWAAKNRSKIYSAVQSAVNLNSSLNKKVYGNILYFFFYFPDMFIAAHMLYFKWVILTCNNLFIEVLLQVFWKTLRFTLADKM